jgi:hypothetical protein
MLTSQSGDSTAGAPASTALPAPLPSSESSQDQIDRSYKVYHCEWERYEKWLEKDSKAYNIMWQHMKDDCKPILGTGTSFKAWSAVKTIYQVIIFISLIKAFEKMIN